MATSVPNTTVTLVPKQPQSVKMQSGKHYQMRKPGNAGTPSDLQIPDQLIATRQGDNLHVRYADGSAVTFEDFYTVCQNASTCSVTLAADAPSGITLAGDTAAGTVSADNGTLVYAHGNHDVLMAMAQGQPQVLGALDGLGDAPVLTYLPGPADVGAFETAMATVAGIAGLVIANDAIEHFSTLHFNNGDTTVPTVSSVALASATGAQNKTLNAGDIVTVAVVMSEATLVTGSPTLALHIGNSTVQAMYVSGSGSSTLVFSYTILPGQNDANGISIDANSLALNGGTLKDAAGNKAVLTHAALADNANYLVDTTAPTLAITSSASALHAGETATITFSFSEDPGTTFTASDITTTGGTLGALSGSGLSRTATFTPTANLPSGNASITVAADSYTDAAGNTGGAGSTPAISLDTTIPTVNSVALSSATGALSNMLNAGDVVFATVTMSEATLVSGTPTLGLTIGSTVVQARYVSGSGSTALVFSYTILAGQTDANGIAIAANSLALAGGSLKDAAGNVATLTHSAVADNASFLVDTTAPTLAITSSASTLNAGETAAITFSFSEDPGTTFTASDITTTGGTLGALSGSGLTRTATFTPTANLASGNASITVAAGSYNDAAGNAGGAGASPALAIATSIPTVAQVSLSTTHGIQGTHLNEGDSLDISLTMSENVTVTGTPTLALNIGGSTVLATYVSGSGGTTLNFSYTILAGQNDANGISVDANSLALGGGSIKSSGGNTAVLTHSALADNPVYKVDTVAPTLAISSNLSSLHAGDTATITFSFSEDVGTSFTDSNVTVTGGTLGPVSGTGLTRTATFTPTANLASGTASISVAAGVYTDLAGNAGSAASAAAITIDTVAPTVSSVALSSATGAVANTLNAGDVVNATVTLSEATTVTGTPTLGLHVGNNVVQANYVSGSGTNALVFSYTILAGQSDANGISIDANSLALAGGTLKDAAGNAATLSHSGVADNASYLVNTDLPSSAVLALVFDTGNSATDHYTNNAALVLTGAVGSNQYTTGRILNTLTNGNSGAIPVQASDLVWDAFDGNFTRNITLPTTSTDGVRVHMQSHAAFTYGVDTTNTNLAAVLSIATNATADFVFSAAQGKWIYEGSVGYLGALYSVDGGAFSAGYIAPTSQGAHTVLMTQTDAVGNVSAPASYAFILDTVAPTQTVTIVSYTDNAGTGSDGSFGSGTSTDDTTPVLNGTLSAGIASNDVVSIFDAGTLVGVATVAGRNWTFATPTLADGSAHSYTAIVTDAAGNQGTASSAFALAVSSPSERLSNASITGNSTGWNFDAATSTINYINNSIRFNDSNAAPGASAYQVLSNLVVGQSYTVQYELGESGTVGQHTMLASVRDGAVWNAGTQLASDTYEQTSLTATQHSFTFTPTSSTASLVFTNTATANSVNTDLTLNQASVMTTDEAARHAAPPVL